MSIFTKNQESGSDIDMGHSPLKNHKRQRDKNLGKPPPGEKRNLALRIGGNNLVYFIFYNNTRNMQIIFVITSLFRVILKRDKSSS